MTRSTQNIDTRNLWGSTRTWSDCKFIFRKRTTYSTTPTRSMNIKRYVYVMIIILLSLLKFAKWRHQLTACHHLLFFFVFKMNQITFNSDVESGGENNNIVVFNPPPRRRNPAPRQPRRNHPTIRGLREELLPRINALEQDAAWRRRVDLMFHLVVIVVVVYLLIRGMFMS